MANWQWNKVVKGRQVKVLIVAGCGLFFLLVTMIALLTDGRGQKTKSLKNNR